MKKIMVAFAAVAFAAVANAGYVNWSISDVYSTAGVKEVNGYTVYFFVDSFTGDGFTGTTYAQSTAMTDFQSGSFSTTAAIDTGTTEDGYYFAAGVGDGLFINNTSATDTISGYAVAVSDDGQKAFFLAPSTLEMAAGEGNFDLDASGSAVSASWLSASATPEPTSGLLLLIGMAGLALRRRRA